MQHHALLSASKAHRWIECPGSIRLEEQLEPSNHESSFAREGTLAHEYAAKALYLRLTSNAPSVDTATILHAVEVPFDMQFAVGMYIEHVLQQAGQGMIRYGIEAKVLFDDIVPGGFGTCDAWVFNEHTRVLHVVDFKYGRGVSVSADNNPQLELYAYGIANRLDITGVPVENIQMWIVQPRVANGDQISVWTTNLPTLNFMAETIAKAAEDTQKPDAPLVPGESQCRWCPAKLICPALNGIVEEVHEATPEEAVKMDVNRLFYP